jgi:hypothetical protein
MTEQGARGRAVKGHSSTPRDRCDQYIAQVRHTRPAQVRMAEAVDDAVAVVVPAAAIPVHVTIGTGIGAELHHAVGHARTRERMPMATGADEGVHEVARDRCRIVAGGVHLRFDRRRRRCAEHQANNL